MKRGLNMQHYLLYAVKRIHENIFPVVKHDGGSIVIWVWQVGIVVRKRKGKFIKASSRMMSG